MTAPGAPYVGLDIVEITRLAEAVARREERWRERVFTQAEWDAAASRPDRDAALASRFAAKEAALKALRTGWGAGLAWREVEILGGGRSAPELVLHGEARRRAEEASLAFQVSLSHAGGYAVAVVVGWPLPNARNA